MTNEYAKIGSITGQIVSVAGIVSLLASLGIGTLEYVPEIFDRYFDSVPQANRVAGYFVAVGCVLAVAGLGILKVSLYFEHEATARKEDRDADKN